MRGSTATFVLAGLIAGSVSFQSPVLAQATPAAAAGHYSVSSTPNGKLLDDPAAAAVLKRLIPTVYGNEMFQQSGRSLTLKDVQQYEPEVLSEAMLAKIQAELDKLPPHG